MSSSQVTIKDLARILGIAPSTVSRALRDHPDISVQTKKRVNDLAKKMNFHPNPVAISLKGQKTHSLGVIIPQFVHHFFSTVISGIEKVAQEEGYHVLVCSSNESHEREVRVAKVLLNRRVDGLLICISKESKGELHLEEFQKRGIPIVFFDCVSDSLEADKVMIDDFSAAYKAVGHLLEQGCRSIAYLGGPPSLLTNKKRYEGYLQALQDAGFQEDPSLIAHLDHGSLEEGKQATSKFLNGKCLPDGIFATADLLAIGAMKQIKAKGLQVPQDIALVGFSNWEIAALYEPPLSSVMQPGEEMGETATKMLINRIKKGGRAVTTKILHTELLIRDSSLRI